MSDRQKITDEHRRRRAVVYVRQSTLGQIERNTESAARQYALRERAVELGWPVEAIAVVDDDTGRSGASAQDRLAFKELALAAVAVTACGGPRELVSPATPADDTAAHAARMAAPTRGRALSPGAAEAVAPRAEGSTFPDTVASLRGLVTQWRGNVEGICLNLAARKVRYAGSDERLYAALSAGATAVVPYASFLDAATLVGHLSEGEVDALWDAWCL